MKLLNTTFLLAVFTIAGYGQSTFNHVFDNDSSFDHANSVIQTYNGGFVLMGNTLDAGIAYQNLFIVKTDCTGDTIWQKNVPVSYLNGADYGGNIIQLADSSLVMCGTADDSTSAQMFLLKLSNNGDIVWKKFFGGDQDEAGMEMKQTSDGGFVIVGWTQTNSSGLSDAYVVKTDSAGNIEWEEKHGGTDLDTGHSIDIAQDGGYIIGGKTYSYGAVGPDDMYLLKINATGQYEWHKTFGTSGADLGECVLATLDGGYAFIGAHAIGVDYQAYLVKTDSLGNTEWDNLYGRSQWNEYFIDFIQLNDSSYAIAAQRWLDSTEQLEGWLVKLNSNGDSLWSKTWGNTDVNDYLVDIIQTSDNGYALCGQYNRIGGTKQDQWLVKTDSLGCDSIACALDCITCDFVSIYSYLNIDSFVVALDDSVLVQFNDTSLGTITYIWDFGNGETSLEQNPSHYFQTGLHNITATASFGSCSKVSILELTVLVNEIDGLKYSDGFRLYPNPNTGAFTLEFSYGMDTEAKFYLYDVMGRNVKIYTVSNQYNVITINDASLNGGLYFYELVIDGEVKASDKMIIQK